MKALTLSSFGSSDVLEYKEVNDPVLNGNEILVEMKAIGLNFADLMRRNGVYPIRGKAPYINGFEGVGIVKDNNGHVRNHSQFIFNCCVQVVRFACCCFRTYCF